LYSYVGKEFLQDVKFHADHWGVTLYPELTERTLTFSYYHGLSTPIIQPTPSLIAVKPIIEVTGDLVLRFGVLEGDALVNAKTVVYDPQNPHRPDYFDANGSTADRLAYVLNRSEVFLLTGKQSIDDAANYLISEKNVDVVVVKSGAFGAVVYEGFAKDKISAYETPYIWPIGSGDVFAAVFSFYWGQKKLSASNAAEYASRGAAIYCDSKSTSLNQGQLECEPFPYRPLIPKNDPGECMIYIAGPFFTMSQYWLVSEARNALLGSGYKVFSPVHDVGIGSAEEVVKKDLEGLKKCKVVLALCDGLDSGTLFEVGYAVNQGIPVVAFAEQTSVEAMKMLDGTGCRTIKDFTTAIYHTQWLALTQ